MIVTKAIAIGFILFASEAAANICQGRWNGEQLPNPSDCASFYVCNFGEPKLFKCFDNLLYDSSKRVCNWPYMVNCGQLGQPLSPTNPNYFPPSEMEQQGSPHYSPVAPYYPTNAPSYVDNSQGYPEHPGYTQGHPANPHEYQTNSPGYPANPPEYPPNPPEYPAHPHEHHTHSPQPEGNAPSYPPISILPDSPDYNTIVEVYPGLIESPANVFHCTNPEFYFAPHPRSCQKYFICENYRIHSHQCGEGINWDYVYHQCEFPFKSFCYEVPSIGFPEPVATTIGVTIAIELIDPPTAAPAIEPSTVAPVIEPSTVAPVIEPSTEAPVIEPSTVAPEIEPSTEAPVIEPSTVAPVIEPSTEAPVIEPSTVAPTIEPSTVAPVIEPSTVAPVIEPSTVAPVIEPSTVAPVIIDCPETQAFIAHPGDCHKYYICIGGIPIVTSCPDKMAWDKDMSQCNENAWSECFGDILS